MQDRAKVENSFQIFFITFSLEYKAYLENTESVRLKYLSWDEVKMGDVQHDSRKLAAPEHIEGYGLGLSFDPALPNNGTFNRTSHRSPAFLDKMADPIDSAL